ncbi:MAG: hypothetical protein Q8J65_11220 [Nitrosomonadales bacterium]|nr:hypothetical protein [Nitrosomonadales bacterium]
MLDAAKPLYIDAHVHLHDPANALGDLRQAAAGFISAGSDAQPAVVMLAERAGYDVFNLLQSELPSTDEPAVLWFLHGSQHLMIVAGRQIITEEGLEVLGLGSRQILPDGMPLGEVIARLDEADAITVLPWGAGKWLGKRGKIVDACLANSEPGKIFLGDNGGRPKWWPVRQFKSKFKILSGSDPLPLLGSASTLGRFGSLMEFTLPEQKPLQALKQALRQSGTIIRSYGKLASIPRFINDQSRLRLDQKMQPGPHRERTA